MNRTVQILSSQSRLRRYSYKCHVSPQFYALYQPHRAIMLSSLGVNLLLFFLIPTLNALIVVVIMRTKRLQTPSNVLVANAAIVDALIGSLSNLLFSLNFLLGNYRMHNCTLYTISYLFLQLFATLSFLLIVAINVDRYIAITKPYFYQHHIASKPFNYAYFVAVLWIVNTIIVSVTITGPYLLYLQIYCGSLFVLTIAWCCYMHVTINTAVKKVAVNIKKTTVRHRNSKEPKNTYDSNTKTTTTTSTATITRTQAEITRRAMKLKRLRRKRPKQRKLKVATLSMLMLASMLVTYIPYCICVVYWRLGRDSDTVQTLNMWAFTSACMKSLINPILYCYMLTRIRVQVKKFLGISVSPTQQAITQVYA